MEDFSRFLIFEFEISNADPDSRSDALAHTKRIALSCTFVIGTIAIFIAMTNSGGSDSYLMSLLKSMQGSFVMTIAIASTMTWVLGFMGT